MMAHARHHAFDGAGLVERKYLSWTEPLALESGARLGPVTLAYETYGRLNAAGSNAILLLHALSGDAHAAGRHSIDDPRPGWWDDMVGPGRPFDTERYYLICSNVIGGCRGSTGPSSLNPATGMAYGSQFPVLTIGDMVQAQTRLLDALGVEQLLAVAGGSMGGFQALEWATRYAPRVRGAIVLASSARSSVQTMAWNAIGRRAIMSDPRWRSGDYYSGERPVDGLAVARMLGHITYLSEPALEAKFGRQRIGGRQPRYTLEAEFEIERYLEYRGASFNARFDANSYLHITRAMDYWDLPATYGSLDRAMARSQAAFLLLSYSSDWLYPTPESRAIADALSRQRRPVEHLEIQTEAGHDAFLVESAAQAPIISRFLERLTLREV